MSNLSILVPSFQYGRFIAEAIASVLELEGSEAKLIVQDGVSSDDTIRILTSFGHRIDWVSEPDRGPFDALNQALARADSEWVGWLNADEFYLPSGMKALLEAGSGSGADVVHGDAVFVDESGRFIRLLPQHAPNAFVLRRYGPTAPTCATIFRRSILGETPFNPDLGMVGDWDLYLKLLSRGARFLHVPVPVGAFRVHEARITAQPARYEKDFQWMEEQYGAAPPDRRQLARAAHGILKLRDGAYWRQIRARKLRGREFRWFSSPEARQNVLELERIYGVGTQT